MSEARDAAGLAALSISESILLSLAENGIIDEAEVRGILDDAAAAHRGAAPLADGDGAGAAHAEAASIIEAIRDHGNSVRRTRPAPAAG